MSEEKKITSEIQNVNNEDENFGESNYAKWIHRTGRIFTVVCLLGLFMIPLLSGIITGTKVDIKALLLALVSLLPFIVLGATESFSYAPIMAASGTYIGFIAGRLQPCFGPIASQMEKHDAQPNGKKHEIIASIVTGTIAITVIVILLVCLAGLGFITPYLENPVLQPGYDNMMSAMIGAFAVPMIIKAPRLAASPAVIMILLTLLIGSAKIISIQSVLLPVMLIIAVGTNFGLYKLHFFDKLMKK